jgi:hypothetical protein
MKIKAKVSFCGVLSMGKGEVREYSDEAVLSDLLKAGYIEEVVAKETTKAEPSTKKKAVKSSGVNK